MDLSMPVIDGLAATKNYFWDFPHSKIIAVTNHTEMAYLLQMLQVGFKGCIFKNNIFNEVQQAMMAVLDDKLWFPEHLQFDMKLGH
jgi:DNA-binding NarL/FixJ family response regulator